MSIRVPRSVKVFKNGEFKYEYPSVEETALSLMPYAGDMRYSTVRRKLSDAMKNNTPLSGFSFVRNSKYVSSRPVVATNPETGDYFVKPSVGKMGVYIFVRHDRKGKAKISSLS